MQRTALCLSITCGLLACAQPDEVESGAFEGAVPYEGCSSSTCWNSSETTRDGVWEFNLKGLPDTNGIRPRSQNGKAVIFKQIGPELVPFELSIENHSELVGYNADHGWIRGAALKQTRLQMYRGKDPFYDIWITGVRKVVSLVGKPDQLVATYTMLWTEPGAVDTAGGKTLCNVTLTPTTDNKRFHLLGMSKNENLVFSGDRFNPGKMTVSEVADENWVNFGCAGHTLAKLFLNRATIFTQPLPASHARRQMFLKMFVADYCGSGKSFTLTGAPIAFQGTSTHPLYPSPLTITSVDARWTSSGARCVGKPRMDDSPLDTMGQFDYITAELEACHVEWCKNEDLDPEKLGTATELVSVNRALDP